MKQNIKKLKVELKQIAADIKDKKSHRKDRAADGSPGCGYISGLNEARITFRHKHVAYCLARGRTLEQIDRGDGLDMDWVNFIIRSMQPESKEKLYVVVNEKLTPSQQAVQSAHAVAEFMKKYPNTMWSNGHLILLKDSPGYYGDMSVYYGYTHGIEYAYFKEPDLENKVTAVAYFGSGVEKLMKTKVLL